MPFFSILEVNSVLEMHNISNKIEKDLGTGESQLIIQNESKNRR